MHIEYSLVKDIFNKSLEVARSNNITSISEVNIEVGGFVLMNLIYAQKAFNSLKKGTIAESAVLNIKRTPGVLHCNSCQEESEIWFNKEKEKAANEGRLKEHEELEKEIKQMSPLGFIELMNKAFQCRNCYSPNTSLIKGKGVSIKNIRL